jgi:uncharacterized protein YcbK (DUF882 family)
MPAPLVNLGPYSTAKTHTWGIGQSWRWPDFTPYELRQRQTGVVVIDPAFMDQLQELRDAYGKPMLVTSYYRSPEYNDVVSSTGRTGPHTTGRAVDIAVSGIHTAALTFHAYQLGFTGFGWQQKGAGRFLHLDTLEPRSWSY